jgi:hypothetical protein
MDWNKGMKESSFQFGMFSESEWKGGGEDRGRRVRPGSSVGSRFPDSGIKLFVVIDFVVAEL